MKPRDKLKICDKCEHLHKPFIGKPMCEICGCIVRIKVQLKGEKCPLDKW